MKHDEEALERCGETCAEGESGCGYGCLALIIVAIIIDALALWALFCAMQYAAQLFAWLLSLMAAV